MKRKRKKDSVNATYVKFLSLLLILVSCWYSLENTRGNKNYNMVSDDSLTAFRSRMDKEEKGIQRNKLKFCSSGQRFQLDIILKKFLFRKKPENDGAY